MARAFVPAMTGRSDFPVLTRTNYSEWVMLMEVMLQARGMWPEIEGAKDLEDEFGYYNDRSTMEALLRSVLPEMLPTLATKKMEHEEWNFIKTTRMSSARVRDAKAQTLRREFEQLKHKPGESIDELPMRPTGLVSNLSALGDEIKEKLVMQKFLRVIPKRFSQLALSIDSLVDLSTLSMEELTGRFKVADKCFELDAEEEGGSKLLLTEDKWRACACGREQGSFSDGAPRGHKKPHGKGQDYRDKGPVRDGDGKNNGGVRDVKNDHCRYCNIKGHWERDCRKKRHDQAD